MANPQRPIAAFRARLLESVALTAFVNLLPDGSVDPQGGRIYPRHIVDVREPVFPCITLFMGDGNQAVWAPRTFNPAHMLVQFYSTRDVQDCFDMYELASPLLHGQKNALSTAELCVHEVREVWANSGLYVKESGTWQLSARYLFRASIID